MGTTGTLPVCFGGAGHAQSGPHELRVQWTEGHGAGKLEAREAAGGERCALDVKVCGGDHGVCGVGAG